MSITQFIKKVCVQDAIYWGSPVNNGYSGKTYATPVEIKCRWEEKMRVIHDDKGQEFSSKAQILVTQNLDMEGYLYLGTLDSLESVVDETDPKNVTGAYEIIAIDRIPLFKSSTDFVHIVYLGFGNRMI